jgi:hypothetical protein
LGPVPEPGSLENRRWFTHKLSAVTQTNYKNTNNGFLISKFILWKSKFHLFGVKFIYFTECGAALTTDLPVLFKYSMRKNIAKGTSHNLHTF